MTGLPPSFFGDVWQVKQMLIALLCESEMKLADEVIETIIDKVSYVRKVPWWYKILDMKVHLHSVVLLLTDAVLWPLFFLLLSIITIYKLNKRLKLDIVFLLWPDFLGCWSEPRWQNRHCRVAKFCFWKSITAENHDATLPKVCVELFSWNIWIYFHPYFDVQTII